MKSQRQTQRGLVRDRQPDRGEMDAIVGVIAVGWSVFVKESNQTAEKTKI